MTVLGGEITGQVKAPRFSVCNGRKSLILTVLRNQEEKNVYAKMLYRLYRNMPNTGL